VRRLLALLILVSAPLGADTFRILDDNREAMQARVDLIQQAHTSIDVVYFIVRHDRVTLTALALLREARRRGVSDVRLIVDANFLHVPRSVLAHLQDEGIQIRVYHPITLRHPTWLWHRLHEKEIIADGRRYITGGRNLDESYFGLAKGMNYVDRDVFVEGESAGEAQEHFEELWSSRHVADLRVRVSPASRLKASQELDDALASGFVKLNTGTDWSAGLEQAPVRFLSDEKDERVGEQLASLVAKAKRSIVIESPYLVPSREFLDLLASKAQKGVQVTIVTNSLRSSDGVLAQVGYLRYRGRVRRAGIIVWEFKGPDCLHAKSLVIDGKLAMIGSYNVDHRSEDLDSEVMSVADDRHKARELRDLIDVHIANSWWVDNHGNLYRARHWAGERARKIRAWFAKLLLPVIEPQL
jgi:phosphatidylserine/phosphatidylglycerophosphate/cardiolipin synthase-like enzyme